MLPRFRTAVAVVAVAATAALAALAAFAAFAAFAGTRDDAKLPASAAGMQAPNFTGIERWHNSAPLTLDQLRGKVVLVDFWTYSCINCIHTIPYVNDWYRKYRDQGLVVVGVHTPEYPFERDADNVAEALERFGIRYPVAQDNHYDTWRAYGNQYWPALYLIDASGKVVYTRYGEGGYDTTEAAIRAALAQAHAATDAMQRATRTQ
ncbi:TPA: thioredoxin family protein [Burkholderia vietnamiensis]|uniref:thioredoxin family protein n=1 Tax=Burkholderia vietnamiensis TaxID=60552 RepID=UPI0007573D9C|nr:thioredoxin family protein [Burkholderia vietnamiensis]KVE04636.1 thioredoxin [Burkholderia vietnamiensis]KVS00314.1 thioredoxin [Burkholderia vietnamiensis]MBR7913083.1 thioredoxin family protein [Burkholderia vietnamiensis]HDR9183392.1 thioredoxin family protein [Burkholderia vietnamiensis]HDR9277522.1 thioredoxin family protein [Burkholderia vietnamiensis]